MWYAVLRKEMTLQDQFASSFFTIPAGTVWSVKKDPRLGVRATHVSGTSVQYSPLVLTQDEARDLFTRPTRDVDEAVQESFMVCEAVYC